MALNESGSNHRSAHQKTYVDRKKKFAKLCHFVGFFILRYCVCGFPFYFVNFANRHFLDPIIYVSPQIKNGFNHRCSQYQNSSRIGLFHRLTFLYLYFRSQLVLKTLEFPEVPDVANFNGK